MPERIIYDAIEFGLIFSQWRNAKKLTEKAPKILMVKI